MHTPFSCDFPWPAPAKINLFLHITGRRADGYHDLQTVFQFLDLGDSLYFKPRGDGVCRRTQGSPSIPPEQDLAVRAARLLSEASGCGLGADIRVVKRIPLGGGLGGGSSDAATTLIALNRLWNLGFPVYDLIDLGLRLGADVPVFLRAQASWAEGMGEKLWPITLPEPYYLVVSPGVEVPTAEVFNAPELRRDMPPIPLGEFSAASTINVCEAVTCARYPVVAEALSWLGAHAPARMSGTGASVFAAFDKADDAQRVLTQLPSAWSGFVAKGLNRSPVADIMRGL